MSSRVNRPITAPGKITRPEGQPPAASPVQAIRQGAPSEAPRASEDTVATGSPHPANLANLVAFLDILGTQERIKRETFGAVHSLEFSNVVGAAAMKNPDFGFAVFSDATVISAPEDKADRLVAKVSFLFSNWLCEDLLVRGGLALGEIIWLNEPSVDADFSRLPNFRYARVYGKAFSEAVEIERSSGPGSVCYLSQAVADRLSAASPLYVLPGITPMLVWPDRATASFFHGLLKPDLERDQSAAERRHIAATRWYLDQLDRINRFLPDRFSEMAFGSADVAPDAKATKEQR